MSDRRSINRVSPVKLYTRKCLSVVIACIIGATVLSGCAVNRESAKVTPGVDLKTLKSFYVVKFGERQNDVHTLIRDGLIAMGYKASAGVDKKPTGKVDAIVTYRDRWMWDITMYMLELTITLRNPETQFPMAVGNSFHTSITRKSKEEMVEEVLGNIFGKPKKAKTAKKTGS